MVTPIQYFKQNPDATLAEYIHYKESQEQAEKEAENQKQQWFNDHIGHYFRLDFNCNTFIVFQLEYNKNRRGKFIAKKSYQVYIDDKKSYITIENNRFINSLWLPNPYNNVYYSQNTLAEEITKEQYDEYMSKFDIYLSLLDEIKKMS